MISMRYILLILFLFPICIVAVILQQQQRRQQQNQHHQKKRRFPFGRMTLEKRDSDRDLSAAASTTKATADTSNDESSTTGSRSNHDIIDDEVIASMIEEIPEDAIFVHLIVLVHGWMGNALEMEILRKSLDAKTTAAISKMAAAAAEEEEIKATNSSKKHHHFMTYSTTVNEQRTHDGIAAGGTRVANEINQILRSIVSSEQRQDKENNSNNSNNNKREKKNRNSSNNRRTVTLSFVGNSLGGLYSRYALGEIQFQLLDDDGRNNIVIPKLFITTATPHLGIKQNTFIKVPRLIERPIALAMKQTGLDLFSFSSTLHKMTIEPKFVDPLQKFEHRIAYANVHGTDFQVPTATAAFWEEKSNSEHFLCTFGEENEILATEDEEEAKAATAASYYCPMTTPRSRHRSSSSSALAAVNTATETTSSFSYDNDDQDDDDDDDDGPHESIVAIYKTKSNPNIFDDVNKQKEKKKINDDDAVAEDVSLSKYLDAMGWTKVLVDVRPMLPSFSNNNSDDDGDSDDNNENDDPAKTTTTADAKTTAPTKPIKDVVEATTSDGSGGGGGTIGTTPTTESSSSSSVSLNTPRRRITSTTAKDLLKEYGGGQFLTIPLGHTVMVANAKNELYGWINQGGRPIMDSLASKMVDYLLLSSESSPSSSDNSKQ